ncbi:MAG: hypothetical protein H7Y19_08205 [Luteimonas sp.]|nr:hypothetical protein [Luteimonas sp.]
MDFVADALFDGRKLSMLTVVDCYTRECLAIIQSELLTVSSAVVSLQMEAMPASLLASVA